ncbi:haloacid dehalogenase [Clostridia bacterium]|nr:haloacid dehalogenase [Clostridia bacterium]
MTGKFESKSEKFLVITDVDGTLLPDATACVPQLNREAAQEIVRTGFLTIATGRSCGAAREVYRAINGNVPAILYNGSCIYDYANEETLFERCHPEHTADLILQVMGKYKDCGILFSDVKDEYVVREDKYIAGYFERVKITESNAKPQDCTRMLRVLVSCDEEKQDEIYEFLCGVIGEELEVTKSARYFIEILPKGVSKGAALLKLIELIEVPMHNVFAIGDYYNDLEMLTVAGHPITVLSAPDDIKNVCKHVVHDPADGSLMDVLSILKGACC